MNDGGSELDRINSCSGNLDDLRYPEDSFDFESYDLIFALSKAIEWETLNFPADQITGGILVIISQIYKERSDAVKGTNRGLEYFTDECTGEKFVKAKFAIKNCMGTNIYTLNFYFDYPSRGLRKLEINHSLKSFAIYFIKDNLPQDPQIRSYGTIQFRGNQYNVVSERLKEYR